MIYALLYLVFSLHGISWKSFYFHLQSSSSYFLIPHYLVVCVYHILFNQSPVLGLLGSFQYFEIISNATINNLGYLFFLFIQV